MFSPVQFGHQTGRMLPDKSKTKNAHLRRFKAQQAHNKIGNDVTFEQWMEAGRPESLNPDVKVRRGRYA